MGKILIVDDEESIRNLLKLSLELDGHQILLAPDGPTCLAIYDKELPDVVLLDVRMPGMDGIEVLSRIKSKYPDAEVIITTGHGDLDMAVKAIRHEASNFISKPVSDHLLSVSLMKCFERIALKKKLKEYTSNLETLVREANVELERAYQFRENIIENSPDAIVSIRKGGEILIFNSAAEKLVGCKKREVIGKMNIVDIYVPGEARRVMKALKSKDHGGYGRLEKSETTLRDKNGHDIPVYISASLLFEEGVEAGSVGIFSDRREFIYLERQLLRSEKLASLGKLSAGIAHEINQPLTGVLTFASLLLRKFKNDEPTRKDLEIIVRETTRILGIVQGILDFARERPMKRSACKIHEIIDQTLEIVVHQKTFFGIEVNKEYDTSLPEVVVDGGLFEQVFLNIILNAVNAMESSGTLTVRTRISEDGFAEIDFEDTGCGMPDDLIDRIFDPFFTTRDSTEGMGMGLGLAISYGIVRNHNGDISVRSKVGEGTTFTVRLPVNTGDK